MLEVDGTSITNFVLKGTGTSKIISSMSSVLGWSENDLSFAPGTPTQIPLLPNLSGLQMVYIQSRILAQDNAVDGDFGIVSIFEGSK